ncbi:hypothetical protein [Flavobacterium ustbae]|uniref:hypothetical protein n=1 Tax=Flavobacterium ustbae TaxID=2488790 RepID=UPI000F785591|nr:hypothetical protein [Flavobacterium ustbae]
MKILPPIKLHIAFLLCLVLNLSAQNKSATKNFLWELTLPTDMDRGPMRIGIGGSYYFERETIGPRHYANLHISFSKMNFLGNGIPAYKYNGTAYLANAMDAIDGLGASGFDKLAVTSINMKIQVLAAQANLGGSNPFISIGAIMGETNSVNHAAEISKETNLDHLDLMWAGSFITNLNWNNSSDLEARIRNLINSQQNKEDYKNVIRQADNAFSRNNLEEAKSLYGQALRLVPKESYPATQLAKIERALAEKQKKEDIVKNEDTTVESSNNPEAAGPVVKTPRQQTPEEIKQAKNQEIQAKANAQMADIRQKQEAAKLLEADFVSKASNLSQSFSQGNAASSSAEAMREAGLADKIFNSIDDINQEYSRQMQIIEQESNNYAAAKAASVSSYLDATSNRGSQYDAAINGSMKALGGLISQIKADKIERENKERLREEREAQLALLESKRKAALFGIRQKMFELFPEGRLPLESNNVKQSQVYVFAFIADKNALLTQEVCSIAISNVIAVDKLDDGSFPYKSAFANNLKKFGVGKVSIVGYYLYQADAEKMQSSFLGLASKSILQINQFSYGDESMKKGAKTVNPNDFWETGKSNDTAKAKKTEAKKQENFWND